MKLRTLALLAFAAVATTLVAGACSGGDDDATPTKAATTATAPATSTPTPDPQPWKGKTLTFAVVPSENQQKIIDDNKVLRDYLEKSLPGLTVNIFTGPSYAVVIEAAKSEKVDFVVWGPFSYVTAKDTGAKIESVFATAADANTPPGYYSVVYARRDSGIQKIEDIKGKEDQLPVAYADAGSTSGFLAPHKMLLNAGVDVVKLDKQQLLAGGHDKGVLATYQGTTKIGGTFEQQLLNMCKSGLINRVVDTAGGGNFKVDCQKDGAHASTNDDLLVLKKFGLPGSPISYRTTLDSKLRDAVVAALKGWKDSDKAGFVKWIGTIGDATGENAVLVNYPDSSFQTIRDLCNEPALKDYCAKKN